MVVQVEPKEPPPELKAALARAAANGAGQILNKSLMRSDSLTLRNSDAELPQLEEIRHNEAAKRKSFVQDNKDKHRNWNQGWNDGTWRPITPPLGASNDGSDSETFGFGLRGWKAVEVANTAGMTASSSLPTPPESVASPPADEDMEDSKTDPPSKHTRSQQVVVASPPPDGLVSPQPVRPLFRKRIGRGGRVMLDRRAPKRTHSESFPEAKTLLESHPAFNSRPYNLRQAKQVLNADSADAELTNSNLIEDRFMFDNDNDDEEDEEHTPRMYISDPTDNLPIAHRMIWQRNSAQEMASQQQLAQAKMVKMSAGHGNAVALQAAQQQAIQQAQAARASAGGSS